METMDFWCLTNRILFVNIKNIKTNRRKPVFNVLLPLNKGPEMIRYFEKRGRRGINV